MAENMYTAKFMAKSNKTGIPNWLWLVLALIVPLIGGVVGAIFNWKPDKTYAQLLLLIGIVTAILGAVYLPLLVLLAAVLIVAGVIKVSTDNSIVTVIAALIVAFVILRYYGLV